MPKSQSDGAVQEIVTVCPEIHKRNTNTLSMQNVEYANIKPRWYIKQPLRFQWLMINRRQQDSQNYCEVPALSTFLSPIITMKHFTSATTVHDGHSFGALAVPCRYTILHCLHKVAHHCLFSV
jgi:hypothetical protein